MALKKLRIPIGLLFKKLGIEHNPDKEEQVHNPPCDVYISTPENNLAKVNFFVTKETEVCEYELENGSTLITSTKHIVLENGKETFIDKAESVDNVDGKSYKICTKRYRGKEVAYDLSIDYPHLYITPDGSIHHNTTIARIVLLYDLYKLLLLRDPHKKFNLIPTDRIVIALFNATLGLADQVLYEPFKNLIANSEFFQEHLDAENKKTSEIRFVNNIGIVAGSRFTHTLGMAVFGGLLDEANFDVISNQAQESYNALLRRMESRFAQAGGKLPGHLCLVSSEKSPTDFVSQHREKVRGKQGVIIFQYPIWEVKKHLGIYSGKTFKVFIGDETTDPFIIEDESQLQYIDETKVIDVPIELKDKFELDLHNAIRDLAGYSVGSTHRIFKSKNILIKQASVINPVNQQIIRLSFNDKSDVLINYFNINYLKNPLFKECPRVIHIDLSITGDRTGIASGYIKGYKTIERVDPLTLEKHIFSEPEVVIDFVTYIEPLPGERIPFYKIRQFIVDLSRIGYPVAMVTTDGFQSEDMRQQLTQMGYKTALLSVDRTKDPYLSFRDAIYEERVWIPKHDLLIKELLHVEDIGKKIDHPQEFPDGTKGSKDGADAVVGVYWNLVTNKDLIKQLAFQRIHKTEVKEEEQRQSVANLFWKDQID